MVWTTTGNLSNIRANATFPFGVAMLPADQRRGSPTGGGNFYLFKAASAGPAGGRVTFLPGSPARSAPPNGASTPAMSRPGPTPGTRPAMKAVCERFPHAAVARDQLQYAVPELSTHDNQRVTEALNDALQAALTGQGRAGPRAGRRPGGRHPPARMDTPDASPHPARDWCRRAGRRPPSSGRRRATALTFYYPIAVGGPLQAVIDGYCADYRRRPASR